MDLLNLVQAVIEISKSREEYSDEVKKFQLQLDTLCSSLKNLDPNIIPTNLHENIQQELREALELIKQVPEKAGIFDALRAKLPFMNQFQAIRDKSNTLRDLSKILTDVLIMKIADQQNKKVKLNSGEEKVVLVTQFECTAQEENNISQGCEVILKLVSDEETKQAFRKKIMNINEVFPLKFTTPEIVVHKFGREYYLPLASQFPTIATISGEHAIILAKMLSTPIQHQKHQKIDHQPKEQTHNEVFYTCVDNEPDDVDTNLEYENNYEFYLQNKGKQGVFIYRNHGPANEIKLDTWNRITGDKKIQIYPGDKIGILMKKPDYKQVLIGYEFCFKL